MGGLETFWYAMLFDLLVVVAELEAQRLHVAVIHAESVTQDVIGIPSIVAAAEKQAAELKKNTEAELKLFATQSVEALKSEVTNLITGDIASSNVKAALMDPAYMQKVILELVKSWPANEFLTIQASDSDGLKAYFEANAKGLLEKGYKIEKVSGKKASFSIIPADGSYKVTFGEDEFIEFFKEFLRPQLVEMLF